MRKGIKFCQDNGIRLLGGGLSRNGEYFTTLASTKIKSAIQSIRNIMELEDHQICLRLMENTQGVTKVTHILRTMYPSYIEESTRILRDKLKSVLRTCLAGDAPGFGEFAYTMASLPNSKGGSGVTNPLVVQKYAYISAYISTKDEQTKLFPQLSTDFPPEVVHLINLYILEFPPEDHESIKELILLPHKKKQKQLAMLLASEICSSTI
jgi:hypothetical protein